MKKIKKLTAVFLAVIMALGVLTVAPFTVSAAGNSFTAATSYTIGNTVSGSITSTNEADYYKFTIPTSGKITLDVTAYIQTSAYYIYDSEYNRVWLYGTFGNVSWNDTTKVMKFSENIDLTSGTYYLLVKQYNATTGNYNFKMNFSSANESFKETLNGNNNDFNHASYASLGNNYKGQIANNDDSDYYKFTLSTSGKITLDVTAYIQTSAYYIYDSEYNRVWLYGTFGNVSWNDTTKVMKFSENIDLTSGTYYLLVKQYNATTGNYNFKMNFSSANESFKETLNGNNNDFNHASYASLGNNYKGQIANNDDSDYYKFTLSTSGKITLDVTAYIQTSAYYIYDSEYNKVWHYGTFGNVSWNDTTKVMKFSENIDLTSGTYYLLVKQYNATTGNYNFKISQSITPTSIYLNQSSLTLGAGESYTLTKSVYPSNASTSYTWSSSNTSVATVNNGKVTAKNSGTAYITVKTSNGKTAQCKVTVKPAPTSVKTNPSSLTLGVGETYTISESTNSGTYANAANLKWSTTNSSVATVTKGSANKATITAKGIGTAYIKITLYNGKTAQCKVTVKSAPTSVTTNPASVTLGKGETYTISESTNSGTYANAANLKWSTSNSSVATVTKGSANKATITAKGVGTAYIKITLYNGKTAQCKVTVKNAPSSVSLSKTSITLNKGASYTISECTNSGTYANAANLKWTSSNSSVATVTKSSGNKAVIKAKAKGTSYIKITLYNGKTAQCKVTVK